MMFIKQSFISLYFHLPGAPQISGLPPSITLQYGASHSFTSVVTGYPIPDVYWAFKDATNIISSINTVTEPSTVTSILNVTAFHPSDSGDYLCIANNTYYEPVSHSVTVTVHGGMYSGK